MPITGRTGKRDSGLYPGAGGIKHVDPPEVSTSNRGVVMPQASSPRRGVGLEGRGAYWEPDDFTPGCQTGVGINAVDHEGDYGDYDDGTSGRDYDD